MATAMRRITLVCGVGLVTLFWALGAQAQNAVVTTPASAAAQAAGVVTGRVVAQDTQQPARFVQVMLQNVAAATSRGDMTITFQGEGGDGPPQVRVGGGGSLNTRTDAEGNFTLEGVVPGDYYATASAPGYVPLRLLLQAAVSAGADPASLLAAIPQVHVDVQGSSSVTVNLERGGTISGKVAWEDGSPAAGISLSAIAATVGSTGSTASLAGTAQLPAVLQRIQSPGGVTNFATTDDRGVFRISGLPSGDYLLRSVIQPPVQQGRGRGFQFGSAIWVYSPGMFRKADAKAITVKAGEERTDVRMVIDLRSLRTVSGHASAASGPSVASGRVTLVDPNNTDLQLYGSIAPNGDFSVRYVPAGSYTLQVSGASSRVASGRGRDNSEPSVSFQPFTQPVLVSDTDVTGVGVSLTPVASQP
jgi:hypothetical protein